MYNEVVKQSFIKDYMRSRVVMQTTLTGLFNKVEKFEIEKGKDCCEFNLDEILEMFSRFDARSVNVLENSVTYLRAYGNYMVYHQHIMGNNYNPITKDMLANCIDPEIIKQKFLSKTEIDELVAQLFNYSDKALILGLFNGISGKNMEDLVSLREDMLSDDGKVLIFNSGKSIEIDESFREILLKAFAEDELVSMGETMKIRKVKGVGQLYKEGMNALPEVKLTGDKSFRYVYRRIMLIRDYFGIPIFTMKTIQSSGLKHTLEKQLKKTKLSLREFLKTEKGEEISRRYGYNAKNYVDVVADKMQDVL